MAASSVGRDQFSAQIFECGRQFEPSRCALEEIDRLAEIRMVWLEKTADMGRGCRDRGDARVQLRSTLAVDERKLLELVVVCGECDARKQHLVGDVEREPRQDRSAVRFGRSAEPAPCRFGVAFGHREEREQPACVTPHPGRALLEHDLRDVTEATCLTGVARMDRQSPKRDDAGGVEHCSRVGSVLEGEAAFERSCCLGDSSSPQEHAAVPGLEHLVGPPLPVALRGGETVGRDRERFVVAVGDTQELAVPHVREPQALVVAGEDPVAIGLGDQLV
jgi:hypothetical protein